MLSTLTPQRRRGIEYLDDASVDHRLRRRSHRDIGVSNALFGGTRALLAELDMAMPSLPVRATLLDIGTGTGEATALAERHCAKRGVRLQTMGLDFDEGLAAAARRYAHHGVCASALQLPFADRSVDVVTCAQVAHHFEGGDLRQLLLEMHRVARVRVIISDLRRSWIAVAGLWIASYPLGFHPVSRHDGVVSVLRGFTAAELQSLIQETVGAGASVRRRLGFRLTASWTPAAHLDGAGVS